MHTQPPPSAADRQNRSCPHRISLAGVRWLYLDPEWNSVAFLSQQTISGRLIKRSAKRCVVCTDDAVFVKEIRYSGIRSLLKTLVGGTACKEGKINLELAGRGVNVPQVIAYGVATRGGLLRRDLLLTRKVENALPLHDFIVNWHQSQTLSPKLVFIAALARFIRGLHEQGIQHSDLHVGNILVQEKNDRQFFLLDLDRATIHDRPLNQAETVDNLALLLCTFWPNGRSLDRFYFMRFYSGLDRLGTQTENIKAIKATALRVSHGMWKTKSLRCLTTNSRFIKSKSDNFTIYRVRRPEVEKALQALLPDPDGLLEQGVILKDGRTVKAAKIDIDGQAYFLKRYNCKGDLYRFRNALRRSRAVRTWLASWGMTVRGMPVPGALICLEERRVRLLERSYLLFQYVDAERLCDIWPKLDEFDKHRMLSQLAIILATLHQSGCHHGDLKWPNILVSEVEGHRRIVLTDLDGSRVNIRPGAARARKDIERFLKDLRQTGESSNFEVLFLQTWQKWVKS